MRVSAPRRAGGGRDWGCPTLPPAPAGVRSRHRLLAPGVRLRIDLAAGATGPAPSLTERLATLCSGVLRAPGSRRFSLGGNFGGFWADRQLHHPPPAPHTHPAPHSRVLSIRNPPALAGPCGKETCPHPHHAPPRSPEWLRQGFPHLKSGLGEGRGCPFRGAGRKVWERRAASSVVALGLQLHSEAQQVKPS